MHSRTGTQLDVTRYNICNFVILMVNFIYLFVINVENYLFPLLYKLGFMEIMLLQFMWTWVWIMMKNSYVVHSSEGNHETVLVVGETWNIHKQKLLKISNMATTYHPKMYFISTDWMIILSYRLSWLWSIKLIKIYFFLLILLLQSIMNSVIIHFVYHDIKYLK